MTSSIRDSIMQAPSLHAMPSPETPADVVENPTLQGYYRLYESCGEILRRETDALRRLELEKIRQFADTVIAEIEGTDATAGPPAPTPPPVQQAAGGPAGASPPAAPPGAPPPGPPPGQAPALSGANPLAGIMPGAA
jgi:hypothetical protein